MKLHILLVGVLSVVCMVRSSELAYSTIPSGHNRRTSHCLSSGEYLLCSYASNPFSAHSGSPKCSSSMFYDRAPSCAGCFMNAVVYEKPGSSFKVLHYPWTNSYQTIRYLKCAPNSNGSCSGSRSGWFTGRKKCWDRQSTYQVKVYTGPTITTMQQAFEAFTSGRLSTRDAQFNNRCECY